MLTAIRVTDWIVIVLFVGAAIACAVLAFGGRPLLGLVAAGLLAPAVLLALHRVRRDGGAS
jgi:hypothetical protein